MSELKDLRDRLKGAVIQLERVRVTRNNYTDHARLTGKIQGVELALSYIEEELRVRV